MIRDNRLNTVAEAECVSQIELLDFEPAADDIRGEVLSGLLADRKTLPCKLFYDQHGSQLFDAICDLPEYYPTRTELSIMRDYAGEMTDMIGPQSLLVEYGSGSSLKTRILLDHLADLAAYVPIDISRNHLMETAQALALRYPHLVIKPVCADYTRPFWLPLAEDEIPQRTVAYFPGSTIGNFDPAQALEFLKSVRATCGSGSGLLIGVDLKKDPVRLHAAYNDRAGITAAFNLNILRRINRDMGADFDVDAFTHYAFLQPHGGSGGNASGEPSITAGRFGWGIHCRFERGRKHPYRKLLQVYRGVFHRPCQCCGISMQYGLD